jgi:hypothetical protein
MALIEVSAKYQLKDGDGNNQLDEEGKVLTNSATVNYDFGDTLQDAIDLCGEEVVMSNYTAHSKVALQSIIRTKLKAGQTPEQVAEFVSTWKPGMVIERTAVDPKVAFKAAFDAASNEKKAAMLAELGVPADALAGLGL